MLYIYIYIYLHIIIIRIILFRLLYEGPLFSETPTMARRKANAGIT